MIGMVVIVFAQDRMQLAATVFMLAVRTAMRMSVVMRMGMLVHMSMGVWMRVVQVTVPVPVLVLVGVLMRMLVLVTVLMIALGGAVVRHIHLRLNSDVESTH